MFNRSKSEAPDTAIILAAKDGDLENMRELIQRFPLLTNVADDHGNTPLHIAVANRHTQIVEYLLSKQSTNINARNAINNTPLHVAVFLAHTKKDPANRAKYLDIARTLIQKSAETTIPNADSETPSMIATKGFDDRELLDILSNRSSFQLLTPTFFRGAQPAIATVPVLTASPVPA